ncbi:unnamed protein product [Amoebophrya sp. A25]|nr:unnamed protein product [Amoebophrya sp. A25]|eukprot:GSA25T00007266001.1
MEQEYKVNLHPMLGSVLYLTDHGTPTVVVDRKEAYVNAPGVVKLKEGKNSSRTESSWSTLEEACLVAYPRVGKHLVFDGQLLHFADGAFRQAKPTNGERIALLVNLWVGHKPLCCTRLSSKRVERLLEAEKKPAEQLAAAGAENSNACLLNFSSPGLVHYFPDEDDLDVRRRGVASSEDKMNANASTTCSKKMSSSYSWRRETFKSATGSHKFTTHFVTNLPQEEVSSVFYREKEIIEAAVEPPMKKTKKVAKKKKKASEEDQAGPLDEELLDDLIQQGEALKQVFLTTEFPLRRATPQGDVKESSEKIVAVQLTQ